MFVVFVFYTNVDDDVVVLRERALVDPPFRLSLVLYVLHIWQAPVISHTIESGGIGCRRSLRYSCEIYTLNWTLRDC